MASSILEELVEARQARTKCVLVTVAQTRGSVPRAAGAKMIVFANGSISGTVGGGKFESLVVEDSLAALRSNQVGLKHYILREGDPNSFGAICGGELDVLIEPQNAGEALFLFGAGHCARALAHLAEVCGIAITIIEDRDDQLEDLPGVKIRTESALEFISQHVWSEFDAVVLVNRNYQLDRDCLGALLRRPLPGYIGMIGSRRKVKRVYDELAAAGIDPGLFRQIHAPIGFDIGADSPAEIAISILAETYACLRRRSGQAFARELG